MCFVCNGVHSCNTAPFFNAKLNLEARVDTHITPSGSHAWRMRVWQSLRRRLNCLYDTAGRTTRGMLHTAGYLRGVTASYILTAYGRAVVA